MKTTKRALARTVAKFNKEYHRINCENKKTSEDFKRLNVEFEESSKRVKNFMNEVSTALGTKR